MGKHLNIIQSCVKINQHGRLMEKCRPKTQTLNQFAMQISMIGSFRLFPLRLTRISICNAQSPRSKETLLRRASCIVSQLAMPDLGCRFPTDFNFTKCAWNNHPTLFCFGALVLFTLAMYCHFTWVKECVLSEPMATYIKCVFSPCAMTNIILRRFFVYVSFVT